jgi:tetratricopeptide (TPR) repeat protein
MSPSRIALPCLLALAACSSDRSEDPAKQPAQPKVAEPQPAEPEADRIALPWIENDYAAALSQARAAHKPLVIDFWAAWCHTCLSMQQTVMRDVAITAPFKERFVWLAIDTESPGAAEAMARFPVKSWPTFYVVSSQDESVQATQIGSTSVNGFRAFLQRGEKGHLASLEKGGALDPEGFAALQRDADRLFAEKKYKEAAGAYARALSKVESDDRASEVLLAQIASLHKAEDKVACLALGEKELPRVALARTASTADFIYYLDSCAKDAPKDKAAAVRKKALATLREVLGDQTNHLSSDDWSDALIRARELSEELGDQAGAKAFAGEQAKLLDEVVGMASSPMEEMTYVWHRVEVYAYLGRGAEVIDWVKSLEKRLPKEYDPPYRLAWLQLQLGDTEAALAAARRALKLAEGPRRGRILATLAAVHEKRGERKDAIEMRQAALDFYKALPAGQENPRALKKAEEALLKARALPSQAPSTAH